MKNDNLGDKIYNTRRGKGISQEDLADMVGVTRQTVSQWESNKVIPKADKMKLICQILGFDEHIVEGYVDETVEQVDDADIVAEREVTADETEQPNVEKPPVDKRKIAVIITVAAVLLLLTVTAIILSQVLKDPQICGVLFDSNLLGAEHLVSELIAWMLFSFNAAINVFLIVALIYVYLRGRANKDSKENKEYKENSRRYNKRKDGRGRHRKKNIRYTQRKR
ncbi:MAG: helix-turn-helix domain-containing protein, partial [Muribaculaceae bacterium]|nr:helix-turn-helix domain-containing protein [Muribaculaceae bacterium]